MLKPIGLKARSIKNIIAILFYSLVLITPGYIFAANPHWQDYSLTLGTGSDFAVNPEDQNTITFEHVSGWGFGDLFIFMDLTDYPGTNQGKGFYGEFSPRFSFSKLTENEKSFGSIKDVLIATTIEFGKGDVESFMIGPAVDLDLPGFDYFQLNIYKRFTENDRDGETIQITPVWSTTTDLAGSDLIFDGYVDWNINDDGNYENNFHFNPQVKYDLSKRIGLRKKSLLLGFEYSYWKNKYGIKDSSVFNTDQNVFSFIIKSHL